MWVFQVIVGGRGTWLLAYQLLAHGACELAIYHLFAHSAVYVK